MNECGREPQGRLNMISGRNTLLLHGTHLVSIPPPPPGGQRETFVFSFTACGATEGTCLRRHMPPTHRTARLLAQSGATRSVGARYRGVRGAQRKGMLCGCAAQPNNSENADPDNSQEKR